tara:strand:+ start:74 stop:412 length:339 start_codon:yes stop_codon:yes gene_type:complete
MASANDLGQYTKQEPTTEVVDSFIDKDTGITIDVGVPLPQDTRTGSRYPFDKMEINDSIFVALKVGDNGQRLKNRLSQATRTYGKKQEPEQHFILRVRLENEISGVRIWRKD